MATISHKNLPNAQLHECKGASAASLGQVSIADGAGASAYKYANPRGSIYFVDISTPLSITYPAAFTKITPVTVASSTNVEVTEANNGRLTYTGTDTLDFRAICNLSVDQSVGANRDIHLALYKNGSLVPGSTIVTTAPSGLKQLITSLFDVNLATNDYIEAYIKNNGGSGDINVYTYYLGLMGARG